MAATITTWTSPQASRTPAQTLAIFAKEARYELTKYARIPMYFGSTLLFPIMFYVLFGLVMGKQPGGMNVALTTYLLATYGTFGVMGASLFANGVGLAMERGLGWVQVKRASPMPPTAYFVAKTFVSLTFSLLVVVSLLALGVAFGGVRLHALEMLRLAGTLVAGAIPFCAMGLAIGYFAGPNSAPAVVNLIYLPMSFASGLWVPIEFLPKIIQKVATALPGYHLAQLALGVLGAGRGEAPKSHWEALLGFTLLFLGLAFIGFRRDEGKMYG